MNIEKILADEVIYYATLMNLSMLITSKIDHEEPNARLKSVFYSSGRTAHVVIFNPEFLEKCIINNTLKPIVVHELGHAVHCKKDFKLKKSRWFKVLKFIQAAYFKKLYIEMENRVDREMLKFFSLEECIDTLKWVNQQFPRSWDLPSRIKMLRENKKKITIFRIGINEYKAFL